MTETNVQKFYRILAEKTETFGTKKEMMAQLGLRVHNLVRIELDLTATKEQDAFRQFG